MSSGVPRPAPQLIIARQTPASLTMAALKSKRPEMDRADVLAGSTPPSSFLARNKIGLEQGLVTTKSMPNMNSSSTPELKPQGTQHQSDQKTSMDGQENDVQAVFQGQASLVSRPAAAAGRGLQLPGHGTAERCSAGCGRPETPTDDVVPRA